MKIPTLTDLFESLQDRNRLTRALKDRDADEAKRTIVGKSPADLGLTDADFRELTRALGGANIDAAKKIWGMPPDIGGQIPSGHLPEWLVKQYEDRAEAERQAGTTIDIDEGLPFVVVRFTDGREYAFQGDEAQELLDEVPDNINEEDFILAQAQNW